MPLPNKPQRKKVPSNQLFKNVLIKQAIKAPIQDYVKEEDIFLSQTPDAIIYETIIKAFNYLQEKDEKNFSEFSASIQLKNIKKIDNIVDRLLLLIAETQNYDENQPTQTKGCFSLFTFKKDNVIETSKTDLFIQQVVSIATLAELESAMKFYNAIKKLTEGSLHNKNKLFISKKT